MHNDADKSSAITEERSAEAPLGIFQDWLSEVRAAGDHAERGEANKPTHKPRRLSVRTLAAAAILLIAAISTAFLLQAMHVPTGSIRGRLIDLAGNPLSGVAIFLSTDPQRATRTDQHGEFVVRDVPLGRQSLVATVEHNVGQEYVVKDVQQDRNDVGVLTYDVPPPSVRMAPGSGKNWPSR